MINGNHRRLNTSLAIAAALAMASAGAAPKPDLVTDKSKPITKSKQTDNIPRPTKGGKAVKHPEWPRWRQ